MSGKYALIVGNTEYTDPGLTKLTAPAKDVEDFESVLKDPGICAFDTVITLINQSSSTVIAAIDEFYDQKRYDDLLVLYFSGHGIKDEFGSLYLAFKDTIVTRLRRTAIKSADISEVMDQSRSRRQVLILDCCNSGAFPEGAKAQIGGTMGLIKTFQGKGRFVLTASNAIQFAYEGRPVIGETENSLFTHFLVKGLRGEADGNGDGNITVDELYDYAFNEISKITPKQTPTKSSTKQEGDIFLRENIPMIDIKPVPLPPHIVAAIESPEVDIRLGAVRSLTIRLNGKNLGLARSAREALERIEREDDSRLVSQAAAQVLEPIRQAERAEAEGTAREEAESVAAKKAEEEQKAQEEADREAKAQAEKKAQEESERLLADQNAEKERKEKEAKRIAALTAKEERLAREKEEAHRKAQEEKAARVAQERRAAEKAEADRMAREAANRSKPSTRPKSIWALTFFGITGLCVAFAGIIWLSNMGDGTPTEVPSFSTPTQRPPSKTPTEPIPFETPTEIPTFETIEQIGFGPASGSLQHEDDESIEDYESDLDLSDFVASARFSNPYSTATGSWDYGFFFRFKDSDNHYRLVVTSDQEWALRIRNASSESTTVQQGELPNLDVAEGGSNSIQLYIQRERGILLVNGEFIASLDVSAMTNSGNILIGSGFYTGNEIAGYATDFQDFSVNDLPLVFGPENGSLVHEDDTFVENYEAEVTIRDFVVSATFLNPHSTTIGSWAYGILFRDEADANQQYRLAIKSAGEWELGNYVGTSDGTTIHEGQLSNLNIDENGSNTIWLYCQDNKGVLYVNGIFVAELDLSERQNSGSVKVATGMFTDTEIAGYSTEYEDFTIWEIP
jgi:hypothetical protein